MQLAQKHHSKTHRKWTSAQSKSSCYKLMIDSYIKSVTVSSCTYSHHRCYEILLMSLWQCHDVVFT